MNVEKVDVEKVKDIPDIPVEELDIYTMLYDEMLTPAYQTQESSHRLRSTRGLIRASTSAAMAASPSFSSANERSSLDILGLSSLFSLDDFGF